MKTAGKADRKAEYAAQLAQRFTHVRSATQALRAPLSPEDCQVQSMQDASPTKWHLAHTSWFFETFVLETGLAGYQPFHADYRFLFNSYYNAVGEQYPRARRGLLTRPALAEIEDYRRHVDRSVVELLGRNVDLELLRVVELGLHHEQQHQELILTDAKHMLSGNPLHPAYRAGCDRQNTSSLGARSTQRWHEFAAGIREVGHGGDGFCFDNELPRHRVWNEAFLLADTPSSNGEYLEFMADGGYSRPELWLSDGWSAIRERGWRSPLYWSECEGGWRNWTLGGLREVDADEPVCHLSFYEADAFARWSQARLPSEAEWEVAASESAASVSGNFVESGALHPRAVSADASSAPRQLFGDVWEWTGSSYSPYAGYAPGAGALGEYNGKFMSGQMVLRGGSCVTPDSHMRASYRNFFPPDARWQFSGVRLARDAG